MTATPDRTTNHNDYRGELEDGVEFRTVEFVPANGTAVDPLVEEATWFALEAVSANPGAMSEAAAHRTSLGFDCLVEASWQPGRAAVVSEVDWDPNRADRALAVRLAVGILGPRGTTLREAAGLVARADEATASPGVFTTTWVDPSILVTGLDESGRPPRRLGSHAVHLSQAMRSLGDESEVIEIVSRFNPTMSPWSAVVRQLARASTAVRIRATVLASMLSPADRLEIEDGLWRVRCLRERSAGRPEILLDADRAQATLIDLRASLSSPALVGEIAICSHVALPDSLLRSISAAFTSQTDVLRVEGRVEVASNRLVLGGFELRRDPPGWATAQANGVPLRGGLQARELRDLITLAESPIGWPFPAREGLPSLPRDGGVERPVPTALAPDHAVEATVIGATPRGRSIALPLHLRTRHLVATGVWGSGKSTLLCALALDDLRAGRPFLFIDPHGTAADRLADYADYLCVDAVLVDTSDGSTDRLQVLPRLTKSRRSRDEIDTAIRRLADAVATSLLDLEWAGPRWYAGFEPLLELVVVHRGELIDGVVWLNDPQQLRERMKHPDLSELSRSRLLALLSDQNDVRGWITSKLHPLISGDARRIIAPAGRGVELAEELSRERPVIVNLAGLSGAEANLVGHLALSAVIDAALARRATERSLVTCYVDEVHRFPARGLSRVVAEGRKFGVGLAVATQSLGQLSAGLADLATAAGTHAVFRATPDTANRLAPILGVEPQALLAQPDLQATLAVQGQQATTVIVPPYETCPVSRAVKPPKALLGRRDPRPQRKATTPAVTQALSLLLDTSSDIS
jgi:hypothetical protein